MKSVWPGTAGATRLAILVAVPLLIVAAYATGLVDGTRRATPPRETGAVESAVTAEFRKILREAVMIGNDALHSSSPRVGSDPAGSRSQQSTD